MTSKVPSCSEVGVQEMRIEIMKTADAPEASQAEWLLDSEPAGMPMEPNTDFPLRHGNLDKSTPVLLGQG